MSFDYGPPEWSTSPYERWLEAEGIPIHTGLSVPDLKALTVAPWPRKEARGIWVRLHGTEDANGAYLLEIPPGEATSPQRHLYEEMVYVVQGRGTTEVWNGADARMSFEWQPGSLFAIPLNANYRHYNGSGRESARMFAVNSLPLMVNLLHNVDFIFNCPYDFTDRFSGTGDYFSGEGTLHAHKVNIWETNFVADTHSFPLKDRPSRGAGGKNIHFELADNSMAAHISQFPVGTYKKAHRHGPGAHVIVLEGQGYSLMWKEGEEFNKVDWHPGSVVVPPDRWFHQHFNIGAVPARYLALRWGSKKYKVFHDFGVEDDVKAGGDQIEYADQDPHVHQLYAEECRQHGVEVRMAEFIPQGNA